MAKCLYCGKKFKPKRHWQKFCSKECRLKHWDPISGRKMRKVLSEYLHLSQEEIEKLIKKAKED